MPARSAAEMSISLRPMASSSFARFFAHFLPNRTLVHASTATYELVLGRGRRMAVQFHRNHHIVADGTSWRLARCARVNLENGVDELRATCARDSAFAGDAEGRHMPACRINARSRAFNAVLGMNEAEIEFRLGIELERIKGAEERIVGAIDGNGHM